MIILAKASLKNSRVLAPQGPAELGFWRQAQRQLVKLLGSVFPRTDLREPGEAQEVRAEVPAEARRRPSALGPPRRGAFPFRCVGRPPPGCVGPQIFVHELTRQVQQPGTAPLAFAGVRSTKDEQAAPALSVAQCSKSGSAKSDGFSEHPSRSWTTWAFASRVNNNFTSQSCERAEAHFTRHFCTETLRY